MSSTLGTPLCPTFCVLLSLPISIQKHLSVLECDVNRAIQSMCSLITCVPHQVKFLHILAHKNEFYCVIKVSHVNKIFEKYFKGKTVQFHFSFFFKREREREIVEGRGRGISQIPFITSLSKCLWQLGLGSRWSQEHATASSSVTRVARTQALKPSIQLLRYHSSREIQHLDTNFEPKCSDLGHENLNWCLNL